MLASAQSFIQQRYQMLLMGLVGVGFLVLLAELVGYRHFEGLQLIGTGSVILGALVAFAGMGARGKLRQQLGAAFLVLALAGLLGVVFHNGDRLSGEGRERQGELRQGEGQQGDGQGQGQQGQGQGQGQAQGRPGGRPGGFGFRIPPPPLAPLGLSGYCLLGAVVLLGKKDD